MGDKADTALKEGRGFLLPLLSLVLLLCGLGLLAGGIWLMLLGGSAYYVLAGIALDAAAILVWQRKAAGARLYGLFLLATVFWAIMESGFDGWALAPRLAFFLVVGMVFLLPAVRRRLVGGARLIGPMTVIGGLVAAIALGWAGHNWGGYAMADPALADGTASPPRPVAALAASDEVPGDWPVFGYDQGGSRFSPLDQINTGNVGKLKVAWTFRAGPAADGTMGFLEATPTKVGDTLYLCTATNDVIALDAESGKQRWRFRSGINREGFASSQCRGVAYHRSPRETGICRERIITNTVDARLIALDARTGALCPGFGTNGQVSLLTGMGTVLKNYYFVTSAPEVVRGKIVLGGWIADNQSTDEPSGVIRAFDAESGRFAWAFDVGRPGNTGEPGPGETYTRGTPNSWAPMSADPDLGLVFAPTGNPPPDFAGAHRRPFDEKYGSSVVAIDVESGKPRWSFQTVHHDLWDYDVATQPVLADFPTPAGPRKAVIQGTKRGQIFVLDRATGTPLVPVEERPVPQTGQAPGEWLAKTQPFSAGMPALTGPDIAEWRMWGTTPFDQLWCRVQFRKARYEGTFTPPGLTPHIIYPGYGGGMNWGSVSVDRDRNLLLAMTVRAPFYQYLLPRSQADAMGMKPMDNQTKEHNAQHGAQAGTPYAVVSGPFLSPLGVPCSQPPFGVLTAIDLKTRKVVWQRPVGDASSMGPLGMASRIPIEIGVPLIGGSMATRGGVTFMGAAVDATMRAFDTATGAVLWKTQLPAGGNAIPMTYTSPATGRQFVVIAAGGHYAAKRGDYLIAFALPEPGG
jgi:quinoprotein glucose dehydrogenase